MSALTRLLVIFFIVYASMFGGIAEHIPIMKLLHQVGATLILGVWLLSLWRDRRPFPGTAFDWPLWLAGIGWLAAAIAAPNPRVSLEFTWPIFVHILLLYMFLDLMRRGRARWVWEGLFITSAMVVFLSALEIISWYFGLSLLPQLRFEQSWPAIFGLSVPPQIRPIIWAMDDKNAIGAHCVLMLPLVFAWAHTSRVGAARWAFRILAFGIFTTLVFSQSRGAYLGFAAIVGLTILMWLLRPENRVRFPAPMRALLAPRLLLAAAVLGGIGAIGFVFWFTLARGKPSGDDIFRLDFWMSAIEMFRDHPILGVGPYQYGSARLAYPHWEHSAGWIWFRYAHNLPLHLLAEGGIVVFTLLTWLAVRFARVWWATWQAASGSRRREIEAIAIALLAFAVHNMVDAFLTTQLLMPVLVMVAYVAYRHAETPHDSRVTFPFAVRRRMPALLLGALVLVQLAFIPLHNAALEHQRALGLLNAGKLEDALESVRDAQQADRWLKVYWLQEATILGRLAYEDPQQHLSAAIGAYEHGLALLPPWYIGWHNLAALYAQAGRYRDAIRAEQAAIDLYSRPAGYHLKLGEYYEVIGDADKARAAFYEALRLQPSLALSDFWTDADYPGRRTIPFDAIAHFADRPLSAFDLAMYVGHLEYAWQLAEDEDSDVLELRPELRLLSRDRAGCDVCYTLVVQPGVQEDARHYLLLAELMLHDPGTGLSEGLTVEQAANAAWFLSDRTAPWAVYVRARLAERDGASDEQVDELLARSVQLISNTTDLGFSRTVYGITAALDVLPQARTPVQTPFDYQPWLELAERDASRGNWARARSIYERILEHDPYAWRVRSLLEAVPSDE